MNNENERKTLERALESGLVELTIKRRSPLATPFKLIATRRTSCMPKAQRRRLARSLVRTPWCSFYDRTNWRWSTVMWIEIESYTII